MTARRCPHGWSDIGLCLSCCERERDQLRTDLASARAEVERFRAQLDDEVESHANTRAELAAQNVEYRALEKAFNMECARREAAERVVEAARSSRYFSCVCTAMPTPCFPCRVRAAIEAYDAATGEGDGK